MDELYQLDWHDIRFLLQLAKSGGVTRAARALGVSHQTVSRRLNQLETTLGSQLINKSGHQWTLTSKGTKVCALAEKMETAAQEIVQFTRSDPNAFTGRVGITCLAWGFDLLVIPALRNIQAQHPGLTFDLISDDAPMEVQTGQVDLALRFTNAPPQDLIGREIGAIGLAVYGVPELIARLDAGDTDMLPLVQTAQQGGHQRQWPENEKAFGSKVMVNDFTTLVCGVRQGLGVAVLPKIVGDSCVELLASQTVKLGAPRSAWILRNQDSRGSNKIRAVEAEIVKLGRTLLKKTSASAKPYKTA